MTEANSCANISFFDTFIFVTPTAEFITFFPEAKMFEANNCKSENAERQVHDDKSSVADFENNIKGVSFWHFLQ